MRAAGLGFGRVGFLRVYSRELQPWCIRGPLGLNLRGARGNYTWLMDSRNCPSGRHAMQGTVSVCPKSSSMGVPSSS
jgi:hypothetical protein